MAYTTIGTEARVKSTLSSDVDKFRGKYRTYEEQVDSSKIGITFVSPIVSLYDRYRFFILQNSEKKTLALNHKYRPDYVSYEEYGTTNWWTLILYINDIKCIEEFDKDEILVPSMDCITKLMEKSTETLPIKDLNQDDLKVYDNALLYSIPSNNLNDTLSELTSKSTTSSSGDELELETDRFKREEFTLDIPTLRLRYIELENEPVENTINLIIRGKPTYTYGKHYVLTEGSSGRNKITWDPDIVTGSGLVFRLKENDIVQVTYVSK